MWICWIGVIIPCLLAGLRANSVGTDVNVYVVPIYNAAEESSNIIEYMNQKIPYAWEFKPIYEYEIGFTLLIYFAAKVLRSVQWVLFIFQVLSAFPVYYALRRYKSQMPELSTWLGMLVYYSYFYCASLNLMRQFVAISLLIYALTYLYEEKSMKYFLFVAIACSFHISALIGVIVYFVFHYSKSNIIVKYSVRFGKYVLSRDKLKVLFVLLISIILLTSLDVLLWGISGLGLGKFSSYLGSGLTISIKQVLLRIPMLLGIICAGKSVKIKPDYTFWLIIFILELVTGQLSGASTYGYRIALYITGYYIYEYPLMFSSWRNKQLGKFFLILWLFLYWWYMFVYKGGSTNSIAYNFFFN